MTEKNPLAFFHTPDLSEESHPSHRPFGGLVAICKQLGESVPGHRFMDLMTECMVDPHDPDTQAQFLALTRVRVDTLCSRSARIVQAIETLEHSDKTARVLSELLNDLAVMTATTLCLRDGIRNARNKYGHSWTDAHMDEIRRTNEVIEKGQTASASLILYAAREGLLPKAPLDAREAILTKAGIPDNEWHLFDDAFTSPF